MSAPAFRLETRQTQSLTPRLQQAVRLLQLSSLDFGQELQQALSSNPFLEWGDAPLDQADDAGEILEADRGMDDETTLPADEHDMGEGMSPQHEEPSWASAPASSLQDPERDPIQQAPMEPSLHEHLQAQLNLLNLSDRDRLLTGVVVETLDEDGYLRSSLEALQATPGLGAVDTAELQFALNLVQSLEPPGVACRDVRECLQLQLHALPQEVTALPLQIVETCFERLVKHDVSGIAQQLQQPVEAVQQACGFIAKLDPRPGWRLGAQPANYLTPDIIVRRLDGRWVATLNPAAVPKIRLNQLYAELFHRHRESHHGELASHLQEARWTVRNIEQRFNTILRVADAIVVAQQAFFEHGTLAMQPMGLKEIAEALSLHESTVSRATCNKYMATPAGVFELKYFFSRALATRGGNSCSTTAIRAAIREMIKAEKPSQPLSDAEIMRHLTRQGLQVARRTVTKYRQMMRIPAVEQRKQRGQSH
ncbi:RNA polymerase factor sigma-54 [Chitinimonas sp.]|uniref:RNA polymerase factor sigma-54 n=1 Tax=Chitinimonas sp. TaxID=1934313 RepID=UPI002F924618